MPKKIQRPAIITAVLLAVFLLFTILAKTVDVQPIGPMNTEVGFAAVNGAIFKTLGESKFFYILSTIGGLISLLTAGLFAGIGAYQWYKRHDLMKVDKNILAMGGIFLIVIILTRIISLSSIISAVIVTIYVCTRPESMPIKIVQIIFALLIIIRHRSNIVRLVNHSENKVTWVPKL